MRVIRAGVVERSEIIAAEIETAVHHAVQRRISHPVHVRDQCAVGRPSPSDQIWPCCSSTGKLRICAAGRDLFSWEGMLRQVPCGENSMPPDGHSMLSPIKPSERRLAMRTAVGQRCKHAVLCVKTTWRYRSSGAGKLSLTSSERRHHCSSG